MIVLSLAKSIEFLENLCKYKFDYHYYDLHNDFDCESVSLKDNVLFINFKQEANGKSLSLIFTDVEVKGFDFFNVSDSKILTIDNVYRGKVEIDGELKEFLGEKGYFFLEFYEGQRLEFWAKCVGIEKSNTSAKE
ncbi:hypothetical protein [Neobacillus massiliamazoniensis]|uniref:Uncharacterized protein n=1 Tax=Neobacillus massiliamazoniensis TaxID=1499688 RepID=A0A0U1P3B4_9BACI|nr:hypothetical protein [Neobacillus massiliamazoniensis]CRK84795.1 hypothetical protein BN000_04845 [Neobacillus massiliamazoniensis]